MHEQWVDRTKNVACVLVVIGHFYTGLTEAGIAGKTAFYEWSHQTLYYFHVALFFLCSGYLYQKTAKVVSASAWVKNVWKKLITLGIPYVVFSTVTWLTKALFVGSVNAPVEKGLLYTLAAEPLSPYWYLYILFVFFAVTPTISGKRSATVILFVALGLKAVSILFPQMSLYAADKGMEYGVWFVLGMWAQHCRFPQRVRGKAFKAMGWGLLAVFVLCSILLAVGGIKNEAVAFGMGLLGCMAVLLVLINRSEHALSEKLTTFFARYSMPVFLMHTIFAAGIRILLQRVGIDNIVIHILLGLGVSFGGPMVAGWIMGRVAWLDVLLYPGKYIKICPTERTTQNS